MECKKFVRSITYEEARIAANDVLQMDSTIKINKYLQRKFGRKIVELGISSFITQEYQYKEKALVRYQDEIVGISTMDADESE